MTFLVLGDADDVEGFALAGVAGTVCRAREDLERALQPLLDEPAGPVLLLVSPSVARLGGPTFDRLLDRGEPPHLLVLPEGPQRPRPAQP